MKKVLVTGADGFIGSHLTESLLEKGYDVKAFVYYNSFNNWGWLDTLPKEKLDQIEIFAGDVRDPNGVRTAMKGVDQVFHLAALIAIPFSYHSPDSYVDTNIKGTLNVLQAARDLGTEKIMVTSTSEVYGTAQYVPIDEKHPFQGQSPYSATKIGADRLAESFYRSFNLPVAIVRPFNTYGPLIFLRFSALLFLLKFNIYDLVDPQRRQHGEKLAANNIGGKRRRIHKSEERHHDGHQPHHHLVLHGSHSVHALQFHLRFLPARHHPLR